MAETYWPFDGVDTTETQFSQWARNIGEGVKGSTATSDLKVFADSTGMLVKLPAGQALVRGHYYYNTTQLSLTITTANATLPRVDSVVLELDPTANTITAKVVAGTPASTPVAATLTQTDSGIWQQLIALVSVGAAVSTIAAGNVTDSRQFLGQVTLATAQTLQNKTLQSTREVITQVGSAISGTYNYDVLTQNDLYLAAGASANYTINFRGNSGTTLNSTLAVGQTITVVVRSVNVSPAYYPTAFQIDGVSVTPKWQGAASPTAGSTLATDIYTFAITKLSSTPVYTVYASAVKFA